MAPVLIIGAGPAGLSTAAELRRRRIPYRLVERGATLGNSWENSYDSLTLHTGKHMSSLPRRPFPRGSSLFPTRAEFIAYLRDYARAFSLEVETGVHVREIRRESERWIARANGTEIEADRLVMTTGIMASPRVPDFPGRDVYRGSVIHSVAYRRPTPYVGRRVLVVGVGNSGGEIAAELGHAGAKATVLVRTGANVVPREIAGVPLQYIAYGMRKLPRSVRQRIAALVGTMTERRRGPPVLPRPPWGPLDAIPLIGFHLVDAIRAGLVDVKLGKIETFTPGGVRFDDGSEMVFDDVILATGFQAAVEPLGGLIRCDDRGFALRSDRVTSADHAGLWFVGHNYDATGGLANIRIDAQIAAARLALPVRPRNVAAGRA